MQKVVIDKPGGYERLQILESPTPTPTSGEVLIECRACGVNFADCCVRMGVYSSAKLYVGWPITPGFETAGVVTAVADDVSGISPGDRVIACTRFGGYTSHLCVPAEMVIPLPNELSFEQGASIPTIFLTAYYALIELANVRADQRILVHSAAGGVGSALVQLGKIHNCHVTGVVGASHKVDSVGLLGADVVVDKSKESLWQCAKSASPDGFDIVLDANGAETLSHSYKHLAPGGRLVVYGFHTMLSKNRGTPNWVKTAWTYLRTPHFNPLKMTGDNHSVLAFNLSFLFDRMPLFREILSRILGWITEGSLVTPAITSFALEDVAKAHQALESGQTVGKVVLIP